jgi:hypothetical protein
MRREYFGGSLQQEALDIKVQHKLLLIFLFGALAA